MVSLHFAPVQGHTDSAYRHFHSMVYGDCQTYYTPFIRLEKGIIRNKDLKELKSDLNENHQIVPQIIFRNEYELNSLVKIIKENGFKRIDLNMGCPFPLQTGHGRGAATISNKILGSNVEECVKNNPDIEFSVKMRLGLNDPNEWKSMFPFLNNINLKHITLHPRIAKQQYGGEVDMQQFEAFLKESKNPVIYNGDLKTPEDIQNLLKKYQDVKGVMTARGSLGRPSLLSEFHSGETWDKETRLGKMLEFHRLLFNHYSSILCGDTQIISKIQPFWEYAEDEIGRKAWKAIKKASNISKYQTAVALI